MVLILRTGHVAITVADICAEANDGRSTFYLHFAGKEALKLNGLEHLREELAARQGEALASATGDVGMGFSLALFEHARDHIDLYRALIGGGGEEIALDGLKRNLTDLVRRELATEIGSGTTEAIPRDLLVPVCGRRLHARPYLVAGSGSQTISATDGRDGQASGQERLFVL